MGFIGLRLVVFTSPLALTYLSHPNGVNRIDGFVA